MIIYISGKYTKGNIEANIAAARDVAIEVWEAGHVALCPHLNTQHFERDSILEYETYIEGDLELLERCDAILMLPSWQESAGANREYQRAKDRNKKIYFYPFIPDKDAINTSLVVTFGDIISSSNYADNMFSYPPSIRYYRKNRDVEGPTRKTPDSIGFDIRASEDVFIANSYSEPVLIPTGLIVKAPPDYWYSLHLRSSFAIENDLSLINDVGIIDPDYCGPDDEIKIYVRSHSRGRISINRGDRVAQLVFHKNDLPDVKIIEESSNSFAKNTSRGGFGSTGKL